jgi:hypothetical protein
VLYRAMKKVESDLKSLEDLYRKYKELEVPAAFEQDGVTSLPLAEGFRVGTSTTIRASIREGMKQHAYSWLVENGHGDIIAETVNSSTLSATARELREANLELPEKWFNVADMPNTSVTQTK